MRPQLSSWTCYRWGRRATRGPILCATRKTSSSVPLNSPTSTTASAASTYDIVSCELAQCTHMTLVTLARVSHNPCQPEVRERGGVGAQMPWRDLTTSTCAGLRQGPPLRLSAQRGQAAEASSRSRVRRCWAGSVLCPRPGDRRIVRGQLGVRGLVVKMFQALRIPAAGCRGRGGGYRRDEVCRAQSIHERWSADACRLRLGGGRRRQVLPRRGHL